MKKIILFLMMGVLGFTAAACPVCDKQQPKVLRGIAHGAGPESQWDYIIVYVAVAIVLITLFYSLKWLVRPGEKSKDHIKQLTVNAE